MDIKLHEITIGQLVQGYTDSAEEGVTAYGGRLDVRPPYQREFIYNDKQREAVISTVRQGFPLNVMYWSVRDDGTYEIIDGQQRTISICQYVAGDFSHDFRFFHNLTDDEKEQILSYPLMVYVCSGSESEKLSWFKTINIAGVKLTEQELRNAVYAGSWLSDAKRYFSKTGCAAYQIGKNYLNGSPIRQEFLETAIGWISKGNIELYMAAHQHDDTAGELWQYFQNVIHWVQTTFPKYRKEMKGLPWGDYYNQHRDLFLDAQKTEERIAQLMMDSDVTNKRGIYAYLLTGSEKHLSIRAFDDNQKREMYERQRGICANHKDCPHNGATLTLADMEADHITPWSKGGHTTLENCQMLCRECNRRKSGK